MWNYSVHSSVADGLVKLSVSKQIQQECIPVGCIPAALRPYAGVCFPGGGVCSREVSPRGVCLGGMCLLQGGCLLLWVSALGVSAPGGCLLWGVSAPGGVCSRWVSALGGVCSWGVSAPGGCVCIPACTEADTPL